MEDVYLLAADFDEPCPWKEGQRGSWIFIWSAISMTICELPVFNALVHVMRILVLRSFVALV